MVLLPTFRALKKDGRVRTELINHLAASSARGAWHSLVIHYRDGADVQARARLSYGREDRGALGTVRQSVGRVLHVAAGEDFSLRGQQGGAYSELRIWSVGLLHGLSRCTEQALVLFAGDTFLRRAHEIRTDKRIAPDSKPRLSFALRFSMSEEARLKADPRTRTGRALLGGQPGAAVPT